MEVTLGPRSPTGDVVVNTPFFLAKTVDDGFGNLGINFIHIVEVSAVLAGPFNTRLGHHSGDGLLEMLPWHIEDIDWGFLGPSYLEVSSERRSDTVEVVDKKAHRSTWVRSVKMPVVWVLIVVNDINYFGLFAWIFGHGAPYIHDTLYDYVCFRVEILRA